MNTMPNKPDAANPRLRLGSMADVRGAGSLIRSVRRRALMPDRSEVEAVPREFVPVDFADAFIRVHPWHPCSNWMRSRLAGRGCESGDFCRRVLSDESWIFEQVGGANGDEPVSPVAIATSVAAHPRRSPFSFGVRCALRGGRDFFDHGWTRIRRIRIYLCSSVFICGYPSERTDQVAHRCWFVSLVRRVWSL